MLRALAMSLVVMVFGAPAWSDARVTVLMDLLGVSEIVEIMRVEGMAYATELNKEMLNGQGGAFFASQATRIYDPVRMTEQIRGALENDMDAQAVEKATAFFSSDAGMRIVSLELAARRAMMDGAVEEAARSAFEQRADQRDPRVALVRDFMRENDLLDRNVSGAMSANFQFYLGLSDGRLLQQSDEAILADVYSQEQEIREDTDGWLNGYLLMAYQPLEVAEMEAYIAFSQTLSGKRLNAALFEGFEAAFRDISYGLGRAVALSAAGSDI